MQPKHCAFALASLLLFLVLAIGARAQAPSRLVTEPIDESKRVTLSGNVHPLAQPQYDLGRVPDALAVNRVLILLNRPTRREKALQQFLQDVNTRNSSVFHRWLTPEQIGRQFGPADADVQVAEGWLRSQGFVIARTTKSKQYIEFSGTAGDVRNAFHTEIHHYNVKGQQHYANASEISIPSALAPLVRGISPLNNFRAQPYIKVAGRALYSRATKKATPQWTINNPFNSSNLYAYPVAPEDFATQYDVTPLYQSAVTGSGQTIGIINESNIDLSLVAAYQQLFGLSSQTPQIVIDGDDPGTNDAITEAYLDVEVSSAMAPGATVNLYISNGSDFQDPVSLAALRAVEDNQASVLSVSFGSCELGLGNSGNQFWSSLWEEAAAQGQTVVVASGDSGPAGCDPGSEFPALLGFAVNGLASTPWNIAVGGTDFYYSDYASGGQSAQNDWNQNNDSDLGSLKAPLTEQVWNDALGLNILNLYPGTYDDIAGSGGASSCAVSTTTTTNGTVCNSGYPKPNWQAGNGVPSDGVRDVPDISLFASDGSNLSATPICAFAGECAAASQSEIALVGGTSASAPELAGIMALVAQKYGRQGQADFTIYPLAQEQSSAFHDVTLGSNNVNCYEGALDCSLDSNGDGLYTMQNYFAQPGFDLASGLGSIDANVLVNDWNSVTFTPTNTTLSLSTTKIIHGTPITVTTSVASTSGSGTPTGGVAILSTSNLPAAQSQTVLTLTQGTASQSIDSFPGGYYNVTAAYHGDAVYGGSTSSPVALTVTPENSSINFSVLNGQTQQAISSGGSIPYDTPLSFAMQPVGVNAASGKTDGNATGTATFTLDSTSATVALNSAGVAGWTSPALTVGSHSASTTYSGDASFNGSAATPVTFSVTKGSPYMIDSIITPPYGPSEPTYYNVPTGGSLTLGIEVGPFYGALLAVGGPFGTLGPTGTVTFCLGVTQTVCYNPNYTQTVPITAPKGNYSQYSSAMVTFTNIQPGQFGEYFPTYQYNGDANWQSSQLLDLTVINVGSFPTLTPTTTHLSITPASISGPQLANFAISVTGATNAGTAPTGWVYCYTGGVTTVSDFLTQGSGAASSVSFAINSSWFWSSGTNQLTCYYEGDNNYMPSASNVASLSVTQSSADFALAPQQPQITVRSGGAATDVLNLTSFGDFNGVVTLACTPSSSQITCAVNPSAPTLNGAATATLTVNSAAQTSTVPESPKDNGRRGSFALGGSLLVGFVVVLASRKGRCRGMTALCLALFAVLLAAPGCGGGGSGGQHQQQSPPPNSSYYSVLVTATANGFMHNAKVIVVVQ